MMKGKRAKPETHRQPEAMAMTIIPGAVWTSLTDRQQERIYQKLVQTCQQLLGQGVVNEHR
jgi:hypothetical protein